MHTSDFQSAPMHTASVEIDKATYCLFAKLTVKSDQVDKFVSAMKTAIAESRKEPGVVDYRSYRSDRDANVFFNFEAFADKAAFDAHVASPHIAAAGKIFAEVLAGPIEVEIVTNH
jgi:quinol monooxygenase YgiN